MVKTTQKLQTVLLEPDFLQKNGLKCVSIKLSEVLEREKRLDASYFDIEGKRARQAITDCPYPKMPLFGENGFSKEVFYPSRFKRVFVSKGIPIFTASQSLELNPTPDKFISEKTQVDLKVLTLSYGQITITRSGSVGRCSIVTETLRNKIFSDDLIRIKCNNPNKTGYVYAFLKTKIGNKVLTTKNYGSVVTHIEPEHLTSILIPDLPDNITEKTHVNIMRAFELRDEANALMRQAEELVYEQLGLPPLDALKVQYLENVQNEVRTFSLRISDWKHRFDGSFHIPIIDEIVRQLRKSPAELTILGDKRVSEKIILPGRFKRVYVNEEYGVPFLSGGNILQFDPTQVKYLSKKHHSKRIDKELTLHENMILVTCSGTIGNVVLAPKHFENWTANQHILRIVPSKETNAGYIYAFLANSYGKELIKRFTYGSVVDEIDDRQLASVEFPLPSRDIQDKIGNLVLEANRKWSESYLLEKDPIAAVENIIASGKSTNSTPEK